MPYIAHSKVGPVCPNCGAQHNEHNAATVLVSLRPSSVQSSDIGRTDARIVTLDFSATREEYITSGSQHRGFRPFS